MSLVGPALRFWSVAAIIVAASSGLAASREEVLTRYNAAMANSLDRAVVGEYLQLLPRDVDGRLVVEGDLLLTEEEAFRHVAASAVMPVAVSSVMLPGAGVPAVVLQAIAAPLAVPQLGEGKTKQFTYEVRREDFPSEVSFEFAQKVLAEAAANLEQLCVGCGIRFTRAQGVEPSVRVVPVEKDVPYVAGIAPAQGGATAQLRLSSNFFMLPAREQVAVMEHQFAHVVGYRHDLVASPTCHFDGQEWHLVGDSTDKLRTSCSGANRLPSQIGILLSVPASAAVLALQVVKAGAEAPPTPAGTLIIRFEGGEMPGNIIQVLRILHESRALPSTERTVLAGKSVCDAVDAQLPIRCTAAVLQLLSDMNGGTLVSKPQRQDRRIQVPDVKFERYVFLLKTDEQKARNMEKNWGPWFRGRKGGGDGRVVIESTGYELSISGLDEETVAQIMDKVETKQVKNLVVQYVDPPKPQKMYSAPDPIDVMKKIAAGVIEKREEAELSTLVNEEGLEEKCECRQTRKPVVVLDTPVMLNHPDLSILEAGEVGDSYTCRDTLWTESHHGTHLAGIVAARKNGFGFVGLDPRAVIDSWPWSEQRAGDISTDMRNWGSSGQRAVFLFASDWTLTTGLNELEGGLLKKDATKRDLRVYRHMVAREIERFSDEALWVVAAGQAEKEGEAPYEISDRTLKGPMNLGDLPNVVVVSACESVDVAGVPRPHCRDASTRLMERANWSPTMVHVAAPGRDVPSTAAEREYAQASGTSQAAAFVAGLASRMLCCDPSASPARIKRRLQYTSRPAFFGERRRKLAAGIVDPHVALLDPQKKWFLPKGGSRYVTASKFKWCTKLVTLKDPYDPNEPVGQAATTSILRIVRVNLPATQGWVLFTVGEKAGEVVQIGPGVIDMESALAEVNGESYNAADIVDLLIYAGNGSTSCE